MAIADRFEHVKEDLFGELFDQRRLHVIDQVSQVIDSVIHDNENEAFILKRVFDSHYIFMLQFHHYFLFQIRCFQTSIGHLMFVKHFDSHVTMVHIVKDFHDARLSAVAATQLIDCVPIVK